MEQIKIFTGSDHRAIENEVNNFIQSKITEKIEVKSFAINSTAIPIPNQLSREISLAFHHFGILTYKTGVCLSE